MAKNLYGPAIAQNVSSPPMTKKEEWNSDKTKDYPEVSCPQVTQPPSYPAPKTFLNKISTLLVINNFKLTKSKDIE